jgi:hypothetical protein
MAQPANGPVYYSPEITGIDSQAIDASWKALIHAVINKDLPKIKSLSADGISWSDASQKNIDSSFKIGPIELFIDSLYDLITKIESDTGAHSYFRNLLAVAAYDPKNSFKATSEELDPVSFSILFTLYPEGTPNNKGWAFNYDRAKGKIQFRGVATF